MYLLDTDTVIYALKGHSAVVKNLDIHRYAPMRICVVTMMELYYGAHKSQQVAANLAKVRAVENGFDIIAVNDIVSETFGMLKAKMETKGQPLDDFDLVIGACALAHNLTLVTNNVKHFQRIEGLRLENWAQS